MRPELDHPEWIQAEIDDHRRKEWRETGLILAGMLICIGVGTTAITLAAIWIAS